MANYFANSAIGPNISTIDANGPFWPNKPCLSKLVKASVRRLLKEMVEYSTKELDSNLPKATPLKRVASAQGCSSLPEKGHINVPMKRGDWLCPK